MRLIDADAMIKDLEKKVDENCTDFHKETVGLDLVISKMVEATMIEGDIRTAKEWINAQPIIEIIRCRECKYFWKYSDLSTKCVFHLSHVNADDFCSYGAMK